MGFAIRLSYSLQARHSVASMKLDERQGYAPATVAKVVYRTACSSRPPVRTAVGCSYKLLMFLKRVLPDRFAEMVVDRLYLPHSR